jgi:TrpR family trp operon transcriptional repressor
MRTDGWHTFLKLCTATENERSLSELLEFFLTPEEKASVESRCLIIKELLKQQKPQREISGTLNVSIAKITRGSNELKRISPRLKQFLHQQLVK